MAMVTKTVLVRHMPKKMRELIMDQGVRSCIPVQARINTINRYTNNTNITIIITTAATLSPTKMIVAPVDTLLAITRTLPEKTVADTTQCTAPNATNRSHLIISYPIPLVTPKLVHHNSKYTINSNNNNTHRVHMTMVAMDIHKLRNSQ